MDEENREKEKKGEEKERKEESKTWNLLHFLWCCLQLFSNAERILVRKALWDWSWIS